MRGMYRREGMWKRKGDPRKLARAIENCTWPGKMGEIERIEEQRGPRGEIEGRERKRAGRRRDKGKDGSWRVL